MDKTIYKNLDTDIKKEDTVWYLLNRRRRDLNCPPRNIVIYSLPYRSFKFLISRHKCRPAFATGNGWHLCPRRARVKYIKKEDTVWYLLNRRRRDLNCPPRNIVIYSLPYRSFKFLISRHKCRPAFATGNGWHLCPRRARVKYIKKEDTVWYLP